MMQNFYIPDLPIREIKPRQKGLTMVIDKGLSVEEAKNMIDVAEHLIDYVKLGFGTSYLTRKLKEKIQLYTKNNINVYFGGTLFETFLIRNIIDDYFKLLQEFGLKYVEISDGTLNLPHKEKLKYIEKFAKTFTVLSEVGSKSKEVVIPETQWVEYMNLELQAGASYVIAEAREAGNVGIYDDAGSVKINLVELISQNVDINKIIWEAPTKNQQVWFIKNFGPNVNLGNIATNDIIPLETLRLGLRSDTFFDFFKKKNFE